MSAATPMASTATVRARMTTQKRRDTTPELAIRGLLHAAGLRYRIDQPVRGTRRRADITFTRARLVVFVDGCFWHQCPDHATIPKTNTEWWLEKLDRNVARDRDTDRLLSAAGWRVIRVWEHERPVDAAKRILNTIRLLCPAASRLRAGSLHNDHTFEPGTSAVATRRASQGW